MDEQKMKILVAVDGSDNSKRALIEAKKFVNQEHVELTLLTVVKPLISEYYDNIDAPKLNDPNELKKAGRSIIDQSIQILGKSHNEIIGKVRRGNPADEILEENEQEDYDLIIMGSRGLGAFSRAFLGSISNKVLNHVETDVLIVR